jgi:iron complex outermembrane receptor protein
MKLRFLVTAAALAIPVAAQAAESADEQAQGDEIIVTGTAQERYDFRDTGTITRTGTDLADLPRSIDVIPEQLLLDQQVRELEDVYRMAPNVVNVDGFGGTREDYMIRGFRRRDDIYRNGVRLKTSSRIDPSTVESIQIIKGPVADLGQMTPGGLINIVTKKPVFEQKGSFTLNGDEHGRRRATFDVTGPLSDEFAYRLTASVEDSENFRDAVVKRQFISSSVLWKGQSGATARLNYEYSNDSRDLDRGFMTIPMASGGREVVDAPLSRRFDVPALSERNADYNLIEADLSVPLSDVWKIESKLAYVNEGTEDKRAEVVGVSAAGLLTRQLQGNRDRTIETRFGRLQAVGRYDGSVPVTLVFGAEYFQQNEDWINFGGAVQTGGTITDPASFTVVDDSATSLGSAFNVAQKSYGPYVQAEVTVLSNLILSAGLRLEYFDSSYSAVNLTTSAARSADPDRDHHLSKSFGAVWKPVSSLSVYASYADTFQSQNIYTGNQTLVTLPPEQGRQYEAGVKWEGMSGRLFLTAAVFDIRQNNVAETVNGEPELTGGISSRGWEAALVANPVPGLNIRGSIGMADVEIISDNAMDGNRPGNVPKATANLWASYELQKGPLAGLGLGGGVSHVGKRFGDNGHTYVLDAYTVFDGGLWYYLPLDSHGGRIRIDLGVKNIGDERYFSASGGTFRIAVGQPRTFYGGLRFEF